MALVAVLVAVLVAAGSPAEAATKKKRRLAQLERATVAVIGDFGTADARSERVANLVKSWSADSVVTVGDNYYETAGGTGTDRYDSAVGRFYCPFLGGVAPGEWCDGAQTEVNRFWPATGNHDYQEAGIDNYLAYFDLPSNERYYDVVIGPLHVFVIDSQRARNVERSPQRAWLKSALAGSASSWKAVVLHHPPYSSGPSGPTKVLRWPFNRWGADVVMAGHEHFYERLAAEGIPYLINGLGGARRYRFKAIDPGSVRRFRADWGALRLKATATSLKGAFVSVGSGTKDRFSLSRPVTRPRPFTKRVPERAERGVKTSVKLRWAPSAGGYSYEYCVDATLNGRCGKGWQNVGPRLHAKVSGLKRGKRYEWQVRALNSAGSRLANHGSWWRFTTRR
ncbi:hypothetical protein BH23CHL8_BH23CHL8_10010 [soil metagenome]